MNPSVGPFQVAPLGVGTWAWGDRMVWGYGGEFGDRDLREAFDASVAAGITLFDTAEVYGGGRSETLVGTFVKETKANVVVATKCFPFPWRWGKYALRWALRRSLRRLGVASIGLYQMHWPFPPVPISTWMDAMADAVAEGLVKSVGVSNYNVAQMRLAYDILDRRGIRLASNQIKLNLLDRAPMDNGLLDACRERGVMVIAYSPLAMGVLSGKYSPQSPPRGWRSRRFTPAYLRRLQPLLDRVGDVAAAYGTTRAQVALNWLIAHGTVPIPGAKNAEQAKDNAGALGWSLRAEDVAALNAMKV